MQLSISNLAGAFLDYAVAQALGKTVGYSYHAWAQDLFTINGYPADWIDKHLTSIEDHPYLLLNAGTAVKIPAYSSDWRHASPVLGQHPMAFDLVRDPATHLVSGYLARSMRTEYLQYGWIAGPTQLVAAMRCLCHCVAGSDLAELPDELLETA